VGAVGIIAWCIVGLIAGGIARRIVGTPKQGCLVTIAIGVIGAFLAGAAYSLATGERLDAFDELRLGAIVAATLGATALLWLLQALSSRRR
jgi:uncharacterized membrane protein YeaQ/YmgE (transglycosylase-associated protein family)